MASQQISVPLTGDELHEIAEVVTSVTARLNTLQDGTDLDELMPGIEDVVVTITRPDFPDEIVGEVRWHGDGWFAFYPYRVSE